MDQGAQAGTRTATAGAPTLAEIYAAKLRIAPFLNPTPMLESATLSRMTGVALRLKAEHLQKTGSFKPRGAINAVLQLPPAARARGVVTFSAGNHGQGLAYAAQLAGVRCTVFMAENAAPAKVEAIRAYGAEIRFGAAIAEAFAAMERFAADSGAAFVSPFADPAIIAGQGTVGLEILEQFPQVEQIVIAIGGGGLISGVALAVKAIKREVRIVGVEPEHSDAVSQALQAGAPVTIERNTTVADGLAAPFTTELPLAIIREQVDDVVLVSDDEILAALRLILTRTKQLVEPAGAATIAALLTNKAAAAHGASTVAILSGGNIDTERLKGVL